MSSPFAVEFDQRSIKRARDMVDKYRGKRLAERLTRGAVQATRMLVNPLRAVASRDKGEHVRSIKARAARGIGGIVGPTDRKRHLVIQPHRIVTPGGRDTGRKTVGNPYVDAVASSHTDAAVREIANILHGP